MTMGAFYRHPVPEHDRRQDERTDAAASGHPYLHGHRAVFAFFHAYASINMKANQTISGTALNMFAPAFAIFVARVIQGVQQIQFNNTFRIESVPLLGSIPFFGPLLFQNTYITTYLGVAILILSTLVLYRTRFGLRLRSCGEHPQAADAAGINVCRMQYAGVLISGVLGGLGGWCSWCPHPPTLTRTWPDTGSWPWRSLSSDSGSR